MSTSISNLTNNYNNNMELDEEYDDDNPLGIGTSNLSLLQRNGLSGIRPLTIADLLSTKPLKFLEGKQLQEEEIPHTAINARPQPLKSITPSETTSRPISSPSTTTSILKPLPSIPLQSQQQSKSLAPPGHFPLIDPAVSWPKHHPIGKGLANEGNTCFLNSALQVLLHTAPLVRFISGSKHDKANCLFRQKKDFCMTCSMEMLYTASFGSNSRTYYSPTTVTKNIRKIASHLRLGRQEDAHEFLRFCIDNMQLSCLFGKPAKIDQAIKDSTFVHQIFGGRLRSRVTCQVCSHPSDTFDSMLDLSLDIQRAASVKDALNTFVKVDELKGANKYKCEKCKKLVIAQKSFTIEQAPMVLSIHLKRFTAAGRKISDRVNYQDTLQLGPYMSDPSSNPTYKLYGVINHSGGGPHSGHYTAHVKSSSNQWYHMNDNIVSSESQPPLSSKNAYILFYCREQGNKLSSAINGGTSASAANRNSMNMNGKRSRDSLDGSAPVERTNGNGIPSAAKKAFIGPQHPNNNNNSPRPPTVLSTNQQSRSPSNGYTNPYSTSNGQGGNNNNNNNRNNNNTSPQRHQFQSKSNNGQKYKVINSMNGKHKPRVLSS